MANVTDPLIAQVSGSDPQNLMEYLTRQRLYDSRYWKETCFGLTVKDVLLESSHSKNCVAIGHLQFLALTLKLLQLHPDTDAVALSFMQQADFKYTRALGALYLRLTARPADIYHHLEPLLSDGRKLRYYNKNTTIDPYTFVHMDEWIHQLLRDTEASGIALPRLPQRQALVAGMYLEDGPRPTALMEVAEYQRRLEQVQQQQQEQEQQNDDADVQARAALHYLRYKALTQKHPAAMQAWNEKYAKYYDKEQDGNDDDAPERKRAKKSFALFASDRKKSKSKHSTINSDPQAPPKEGSEEYWNEQRAKLGLAPLRK